MSKQKGTLNGYDRITEHRAFLNVFNQSAMLVYISLLPNHITQVRSKGVANKC